ncbi:MAG: hypothetical protein AAGI72_15565 [Pseudomonadota bacterium]
MPYDAFVDAAPVASDTGNDFADTTRENLMALRDAVVMGLMKGWTYAPVGGTAAQPAQFLYSKGLERIRGTVTWGTSGGADGNVTQIVWAYSADSGSSYDTITTESVTYDADGFVTGCSST